MSSSLHLIPSIIGQEQTLEHIIPILDKYLTDLEDIRQVSMRHIVDFMEVLNEEQSTTILTLIQQTIQNPDWRVRKYISKQLGELAKNGKSFAQYIDDICTSLLVDPVYKVRITAAKQMGSVLCFFDEMNYVNLNVLIQKIRDVVDDQLKARREIVVFVVVSVLLKVKIDKFLDWFGNSFEILLNSKFFQTRVLFARELNAACRLRIELLDWDCVKKARSMLNEDVEIRKLLVEDESCG